MSRIYVLVIAYVAAAILFVVLATRGSVKSFDANMKVVRLAVDTEPKTLDPISITETISDGVARKVYNMLVRLERTPQNTLEIRGDLAERYDVSPDNKTYTFHLRRNVKFHDGTDMKAADVVYSLKRLLSPRSKRAMWLEPMVVGSTEFLKDNNTKTPLGITAEDDYTVKIELNEPFAPFIQHLCTVNCGIVSPRAVEDTSKTFARNPVGTGPFKLTEWRNFQTLIFSRFDDYFRGKPKLDAIQFSVIKEHNIQLEQFLAGELDAATIPYGQVKKTMAAVGEKNILSYSTMRTNYLGIGMPNGEFKDNPELQFLGKNKLLRQALNYAVDRTYLCETILEGRAVPAKGILPPGMPCYKADRAGWPKNLDKAKELMAKAGYPGGKGLPPLTLLHRTDEDARKIAQSVFGDFEKIGIRLELQSREWNKFIEMTEQQPRQMFTMAWVADYSDPDNFLYVLFNKETWGAEGNHTWFSNDEVNELTNRARRLSSMKEREPLYHKAEDIILDECPWIPTYHVRNVICLSHKVTGIRETVTPLDTGTEFPNVDFAFVDKEN